MFSSELCFHRRLFEPKLGKNDVVWAASQKKNIKDMTKPTYVKLNHNVFDWSSVLDQSLTHYWSKWSRSTTSRIFISFYLIFSTKLFWKFKIWVIPIEFPIAPLSQMTHPQNRLKSLYSTETDVYYMYYYTSSTERELILMFKHDWSYLHLFTCIYYSK